MLVSNLTGILNDEKLGYMNWVDLKKTARALMLSLIFNLFKLFEKCKKWEFIVYKKFECNVFSKFFRIRVKWYIKKKLLFFIAYMLV